MIIAKVIGLDDFYDWVKKQGPIVDQEVRRENQASLLTVGNDYSSAISKHGNLEKGVKIDTNNDWKSGEAGNTHKASIFIEKGARRHTIPLDPVRSPILAFFWPKLGEDVFFKNVDHPGIKAHPALEKAWINHMEPIKKYLERIVKRLNQRMK